jgi:hypothetical protein
MVVIKTMEKKLLTILILSMSLLISIASEEPQMSMETNVDRPGMNYNNYPLSGADPQLCANDCANDPNCKAFTYVKPGFRGENSDPECWLKNGVPGPVPNEYCISGVKQAEQKADAESQPPLNLQLGFTAQNPDHTNIVLSSSDVAVDEAFILILNWFLVPLRNRPSLHRSSSLDSTTALKVQGQVLYNQVFCKWSSL